ncbi:MAG: hypothetical protein MJZ40_04115 [Bacteroidaceae bacterium]|nr:hypothetical protein [Bacteroidaceae bacterium]
MKRILFVLLYSAIASVQTFASTSHRIIYLDELRNIEIKQNEPWFGNYILGENPSIPKGREIPPVSYVENKYDTETWEDGTQISWGNYEVSFCRLVTVTSTAVLMEYDFVHYFIVVCDKAGKMVDYKAIGMSDHENYALVNVQAGTHISVDQYSISPDSHYNRLWSMEFTQRKYSYKITDCGKIIEDSNNSEEKLIASPRHINWGEYQFSQFVQLFTQTKQEQLSPDFLTYRHNCIDFPFVWKYIDTTVLGDPYDNAWWAGKMMRIKDFWICSISKEHTEIGMPQYTETHLLTYTLDGELIDSKAVARFGENLNIYNAKISCIPSSLCFDVVQYYNTHNVISHIKYTIQNDGTIKTTLLR